MKNTIPFMRARYAGLIASAILSLASVFLFFEPGLEYGIDFSGGSMIEVRAPGSNVVSLREQLKAHQVALQEFGGEGHYLMRIPNQSADYVATGNVVQDIKNTVLTLSPGATFPRVECGWAACERRFW